MADMHSFARKFEELADVMVSHENTLRHDIGESINEVIAAAMMVMEEKLQKGIEAAVQSHVLLKLTQNAAEGSCRIPPDNLQAWMASLVQQEQSARMVDSAKLRLDVERLMESIAADMRKLEARTSQLAALLGTLQARCDEHEAAAAALEGELKRIAERPCGPCAPRGGASSSESPETKAGSWIGDNLGASRLRSAPLVARVAAVPPLQGGEAPGPEREGVPRYAALPALRRSAGVGRAAR